MTQSKLSRQYFSEKDIPLFFIPHFGSQSIPEDDSKNGIVTKVVLPIKPGYSRELVVKQFEEIGVHQILLLGNLKIISFFDGEITTKYEVDEKEKTGKVLIKRNDLQYQFKHFKPSRKIKIPSNLIEDLEDNEKEIFRKDPILDISLVFDLDRNNRLVKNPNAKLYLFYPTDITSGFSFIIHSYFLVNPERKVLRNCSLNTFILKAIADSISEEWLPLFKKLHARTFLDFLVFRRNSETPILNTLYNQLIANLNDKKFLFDKEENKFYRIDEVVIADDFDKGLFPSNKLNGKRMIYIENKDTRDWLTEEFDLVYLSYNSIAGNIEKECEYQAKKNNFAFFENLYKYLVDHNDLNLKGKKVLFTNNGELLSNEDYVFYGFKEKVSFPESIRSKIHFIHSKIKISEQRQGKGQTGFIEYSTELLVRRLLKLYEDSSVPKEDILISLFHLNISDRLIPELRQKVLLPVRSSGDKWRNPFFNPVYLESDDLMQLYDESKFVDKSFMDSVPLPDKELRARLIQAGAWTIPAIFFSSGTTTIYMDDKRFGYIRDHIRAYSTPFFEIHGDWHIDRPKTITPFFTESVISNWRKYFAMIEEESNLPVKFKSQTSDQYSIARNQVKFITSFVSFLMNAPWIKVGNKNTPLTVADIVGIDPIESIQVQSFLLKKYLNALPINYASHSSFIQILGISHLDSHHLFDFKEIFRSIYKTYQAKVEYDKEFVSFYNKVLGKLYDYYSVHSVESESINSLAGIHFLGINEISKRFEWKKAMQIYFIEDKPAYDILPEEIKSVIQPHFTNRDKNRFGQIARKIGLDFKKSIQQHIDGVQVEKVLNIWDALPWFAESVALVEVLLESNLDSVLKEFKNTHVLCCESFKVKLFKDGIPITTLEKINHLVLHKEYYEIYILANSDLKKAWLYANVLHDLLVEILGRDLNRIRLSLIDFYSQPRIESYLERYEVSNDRIEEINAKIRGIFLTAKQSFWLAICSLKNLMNPENFILGNSMDFANLFSSVNIEFDNLIDDVEKIDYERMYKSENLTPLLSIFTKLGISLGEFNKVSTIKIDFSEYYQKRLEGLRVKFKPLVELKYYHILREKSTEEKCQFQNVIDSYQEFPIFAPKKILDLDCETFFSELLGKEFPALGPLKYKNVKNTLRVNYRKNLKEFKREIEKANLDYIDDFLLLNKHRSLLYFDDCIEELLISFKDFADAQKGGNNKNAEDFIDLSAFSNSSLLEIENITSTTRGSESEIPGSFSGRGGGKRIDGGKVNPNLNLIGLVAEKMVFEKLSETYADIEWISKNADKAGENPEGSDVHGCDIKYLDEKNDVHYVEVKGKTDITKSFFISYTEYLKAKKEKENYHIYLVLNTFDNSNRQILNLGNIFLLNEYEDLFHNANFSACFSKIEITFN